MMNPTSTYAIQSTAGAVPVRNEKGMNEQNIFFILFTDLDPID